MTQKYLFYLFAILFFNSACSNIDIEKELNRLKPNETVCYIKIGHQYFYKLDSRFSGVLELEKNRLFLNYFDSTSKSNFILTLPQENIVQNREVDGSLYNSSSSTLMIGRIINKQQNKGEGYLMSEGKISIIDISTKRLVLKIKGKVKKYPQTNEEDPSYDIEGVVLQKEPVFQLLKEKLN